MRRQDTNTETIREKCDDLNALVSKAYPNMADAQRVEVLKQKFFSIIKVEDFEKTAMSHDNTAATYSQVVNIMARVEEFRKTKEKGQQRINDDWYLNNMQPRVSSNRQYYNNRRGVYRPWSQDTRQCHHCHVATIALTTKERGLRREMSSLPKGTGRRYAIIVEAITTPDKIVQKPLIIKLAPLSKISHIRQCFRKTRLLATKKRKYGR